ncbi:MAG: hypothetical protein RI560_03465 [Natronomonas sp.]|uniref:hypothetical protein n=1 Tax=Natronomonas sp. TaxID=2184060 RepID=UPI002870A083|nr:hypothetical protein [Natronomonas sp.]MDR9380717.1 hypothetical protein [Natronomonas sp.]MDR9431526.1 hypothetical protein [Natronomonas sp.]
MAPEGRREVYTACPDCGEQIPFYATVDDLKRCPECHTDVDRLFDKAIGSQPIEPVAEPDVDLALTDGGRDE